MSLYVREKRRVFVPQTDRTAGSGSKYITIRADLASSVIDWAAVSLSPRMEGSRKRSAAEAGGAWAKPQEVPP